MTEKLYYKDAYIKSEFEKNLYNGNALRLKFIENYKELNITQGEKIKLYDTNKKFVGLFSYNEKEGLLKVEKMFLN